MGCMYTYWMQASAMLRWTHAIGARPTLSRSAAEAAVYARFMDQATKPSFATIASRNAGEQENGHGSAASGSAASGHSINGKKTSSRPAWKARRSPSPTHVPKSGQEEEATFVLTLQTNGSLHETMTELRKRYFPKHLNKLAAHLTLFHALPGSKLEADILPVVARVAAETQRFRLHAASPFRLRRGMAISVPKHEGGEAAQAVHAALQRPWLEAGFLSEQDAGGCRVHYTIMNKVDDEAGVARAFDEVCEQWPRVWGTADGLALWRYERGYWRWERGFRFAGGPRDGEADEAGESGVHGKV